MNQHDQFEYSEKRGFGAKYGFVIGIVVVGALGVFMVIKMLSGHSGPPLRKQQEIVSIKLPPPPPPTPPPPPPPPQDAPKQEMMSQEPINEDDAKPEPQEAAAPSIGTNVTGNGPADGFGLGKNAGNGWGNGSNKSRANASKFGWYATQVSRSLADALGRNSRTKIAGFNIQAKIWSDAGGRVTKAKLVESTGDAAVDEAIKNEVLIGFQLKEPPPDDMPMPIVMRLVARRPN